MSSFHGHETGAMLDAYDFSGISVLADIGGGNGSLIASVLKRYPGMKYRSLLGQSGFHLNSITPTRSMVSVIEGKPK